MPARYDIDTNSLYADAVCIRFGGSWKITEKLPSIEAIRDKIDADGTIGRILFDTEHLEGWDSGLLTFLVKVKQLCDRNSIELQQEGLPLGVQRLLKLAFAVPEKKGTRGAPVREGFFTRVGTQVLAFNKTLIDLLSFIGEASVTFVKLFVGTARFRRSDLAVLLEDCGAQAFPIVSLISVLVGLILAFVGAVQLRMFGAQIFVADLVGIAMVREMGAMMTGIIMAGRTGAAFAAQLGTMQVNEEIDALSTLGISPMEFLVLPRILALVLMMPLLCIYADIMGILGGVIVGVGMLDITLIQYLHQTTAALDLTNVNIGIFKSVVYGILIALSGCLRGMQCGRSASAVGLAATSAVVTAIVAIVVSDGIFAVLCNALGI